MKAGKTKARLISPAGGAKAINNKSFIATSLSNNPVALINKLPWIVQWASENTIEFYFLIGDYIHRHNEIALENLTPRKAMRSADAKATQVAAQISLALERVGRGRDVILKASALAIEPDFDERFEEFFNSYRSRRQFREIIDQTVQSYLDRRRIYSSPSGKIWDHCVAYQLEELVIFEKMVERGFGSLIYPGPQLPVIKAIVTGNLPGLSERLQTLRLVELRHFEE